MDTGRGADGNPTGGDTKPVLLPPVASKKSPAGQQPFPKLKVTTPATSTPQDTPLRLSMSSDAVQDSKRDVPIAAGKKSLSSLSEKVSLPEAASGTGIALVDKYKANVDDASKKRGLPALRIGSIEAGRAATEDKKKKIKLVAQAGKSGSQPIVPALHLKNIAPGNSSGTASVPTILSGRESVKSRPVVISTDSEAAPVPALHVTASAHIPTPCPFPPVSAPSQAAVVASSPVNDRSSPAMAPLPPPSPSSAPMAGSSDPALHEEATPVPAIPDVASHVKVQPVGSPKSKELVPARGPPVGNAAGRMLIKRGLRAGDPRAFIQRFQEENGLRGIPEARPALQLLDVLGVSRLQVYRHLLADLRARLVDRLDRCQDQAQLERLLAHSFGYLTVPELRTVPERIITKLRRIPSRILDRLAARPGLLEELPMRVKQQVWEAHPALFRRGLGAILEEYVRHRASVMMPAYDVVALLSLSSTPSPSAAGAPGKEVSPSKRRQENPCLAHLVACVNTEDDSKLDQVASHFIIDEYVSKGDPTLCTLFADFQVQLAHVRSGRAAVISRLTHLARALEEWVKAGRVEAKALAQVQVHLRAMLSSSGTGAGRGVTPMSLSSKKEKKRKEADITSSGLTLKLPRAALSTPAADKSWAKIPTLEQALEEGMGYLLKLDAPTRWFAKPVLELWPQIQEAYLAVVPHPMDLESMRKRVKASVGGVGEKERGGTAGYSTFAAFDSDAERVFDNCMAFNPPGSAFHSGAERMKKAWGKFKVKFEKTDVKRAMDRKKGAVGAGGLGDGSGLVTKATTSTFVGAGDEAELLSAAGRGTDKARDPTVPEALPGRPRVEAPTWGHALMLLADPCVLQVLGKTLKQELDEVFRSQGLPKDHPRVPSLLQLLYLGLDARRQLALVRLKPKAGVPPPPPPTEPLHKKGNKKGKTAPSPPELPPCFSIPDARVSFWGFGDKEGEPAAENDVQEAVRTVLPSLLEVNAYVKVANKYATATDGWEGQPHDKDEIEGKMLESVGRLYRACKARQPSPLLLCVLTHALCHSLATGDDDRTTPLAKTLAALLDHLNRKRRSEMTLALPDMQDRALWIGLASAGLLRVPKKKNKAALAGEKANRAGATRAGPVGAGMPAVGGAGVGADRKAHATASTSASARPPLEPELRDLILGIFVNQLPFACSPRSISFCHEQVLRLLLGWMARGALEPPKGKEGREEGKDGIGKRTVRNWVEGIVQGVGGHKAMWEVWEKEEFKCLRRQYERLFEATPWARGVVLGEGGAGVVSESAGPDGVRADESEQQKKMEPLGGKAADDK